MKVLDNLELTLRHYSCSSCWLDAATYADGGGLALVVMARDLDDQFDEQVLIATVNLPGAPKGDNEVYLKNWSENEGLEENLIAWGVIEPEPAGFQRTGFVSAPRYRLTPAFMLKLSDELIKSAKGAIK